MTAMLWYGKSDVGMVRDVNQDNFIVRMLADGSLLCAVCDGMGGKAGGAEASSTALRVFTQEVESFTKSAESAPSAIKDTDIIKMLEDATDTANSEVYKAALSDPALSGMGTTLVAVFIYDGKMFSVNVGDSRMYIISGGRATQHTHDHSYVQYLVDIGKLTPSEAKNSTNRNIITRAVGIDDKVDADISAVGLPKDKGVYILLCSDGLTNHVEDSEIAKIVEDSDTTIEEKADMLISAANKMGGSDNITVVLIKL